MESDENSISEFGYARVTDSAMMVHQQIDNNFCPYDGIVALYKS